MKGPGFIARIVIVAAACAFATSWFGWLSVPVIGFVYALVDRRIPARGTVAALGAALGWLAILAADAARGANVSMVASRMGEVMRLPALGFVAITLLFAALLAGTAAVIGSWVARDSASRNDARVGSAKGDYRSLRNGPDPVIRN